MLYAIKAIAALVILMFLNVNTIFYADRGRGIGNWQVLFSDF